MGYVGPIAAVTPLVFSPGGVSLMRVIWEFRD